jgi:hypothetical protein
MLVHYKTKSQPDGWDFLLYYLTVQAGTLAPAERFVVTKLKLNNLYLNRLMIKSIPLNKIVITIEPIKISNHQ